MNRARSSSLKPPQRGQNARSENFRRKVHKRPDWRSTGLPADFFDDAPAVDVRWLRDGARIIPFPGLVKGAG